MHYLLAKALNKIGLLPKFNTVVRKTTNGKVFNIPIINGVGYECLNISEQWMYDVLKKVVPLKKGIFIDVGVNLGQTLIKFQSIQFPMDYLGFEPNPKCIFYADAVIKANNFQNCKLVPIGLFDKDSVLELNAYSEEDTDSSASLIENFRPSSKVYNKFYVPVFRFESIKNLLGSSSISIIKIDVEGAELEVLQSLRSALSEHRPLLLLEILPCYDESNGDRISRQAQLESLFKELNYKIIRIIKNEVNTAVDEFKLIDTIGIHSDIEWSDYIIAPADVSDKILR